MKVKVSELQGTALDWAVAKCDGLVNEDGLDIGFIRDGAFTPSTDWAQGGPIIERECICVELSMDAPIWCANKGLGRYHHFGPTPLIAAMRCYVASKLGDQIELPEELNHV